jgi:hypothetical protein
VLAALGVAVAPADDGKVGDGEVIVRTDDGRPLSVMQGAAGTLRAGERVALVGGPRIRLAPRAAP